MPTIKFRGTREELEALLAKVPAQLAGRAPDSSGAAEAVIRKAGEALLGEIHEAYRVKSEGGQDAMGISWPRLAPSTLALRSFRTGPGEMKKLKEVLRRLSPSGRAQVRAHARRVAGVLLGDDKKNRKAALRYLERQHRSGKVNDATYRYQKSKLERRVPAAQLRREATAAAFALILRKSRRMMDSLTPTSPEVVLKAEPGKVYVGSKTPYFKYHNSNRPRKQKKSGGDRLPRRQILPDSNAQIPPSWRDAMQDAIRDGVNTADFWLKILGTKASI